MKKLNFLAILLLIGILAISWSNPSTLATTSSTDQQVLAVHPLELIEGVDPAEFETFVHTEVAPICDKIEGMDFMLVKGDRGSRIDKYAVILTFATLKDRNRVYPYGKESPEDWGPDEIWVKFAAMASGLGDISSFVDYVEISR